MPIGNTYLSEYHLASVNYPVVGLMPPFTADSATLSEGTLVSSGSPSFPLSLSGLTDVAFRSFSRSVERPVSQQPLIQGWPLGKISDMQAAHFTYQIEVPIILLPHTSAGAGKYRLRAKEIEFFLSWFSYAVSAMDKVMSSSVSSVVVERLSIQVTPDDVVLQMTIKSNADIGWNLVRSKDNSILGRTARGHDTFLGWGRANGSGLPATWGWQDRYGISTFSMNLASEIEEISASNHVMLGGTGTATPVYNTGHAPDMLNCQLVRHNGGLSVFGLIETSTPDIHNSIQFQTSNDYNTRFGNNVSPTIDEDVFDNTMTSGGIYVVIGSSAGILSGSVVGQPIAFIPTGTLISKASTEASGGTVKINREFAGVTSQIPHAPSASGTVSFTSIIR